MELEDKIARAEVIDVSKLSGTAIKFGATGHPGRRGDRRGADLPDRRRGRGRHQRRPAVGDLAAGARADRQGQGRQRRGRRPRAAPNPTRSSPSTLGDPCSAVPGSVRPEPWWRCPAIPQSEPKARAARLGIARRQAGNGEPSARPRRGDGFCVHRKAAARSARRGPGCRRALWLAAAGGTWTGGVRLVPPWPDLVIGCGRNAVKPALAIRRASGGHTLAAQIQDPGVGARRVRSADRARARPAAAARTWW